MEENLASLLCYAGGWVTGLIFLAIDKRPTVRFHAKQSVVVFGALNLIYLVLVETVNAGLVLMAARLAIVAAWVFLMAKAYQGLRHEVPVVTDIVKALAVVFDKIGPSEFSGANPQETVYVQAGALTPTGPTETPLAPRAPTGAVPNASGASMSAPSGNTTGGGLADLVLPQEVVAQLSAVLQAWQQSAAPGAAVHAANLLVSGPAGTGKTQIARGIAKEGGMAFIHAAPSDFGGGYVGQSSAKIRELFQRGNAQAPCILFFDEFEAIAVPRVSPRADSLTKEAVAELLAQLDGVPRAGRPVFVLAATNREDLVDEAVRDRFANKIRIPLPDLKMRQQILQTLLAKYRLDGDLAQICGELAGMTDGCNGRDLNTRVQEAALAAFQRAESPDQVVVRREDLIRRARNAASS